MKAESLKNDHVILGAARDRCTTRPTIRNGYFFKKKSSLWEQDDAGKEL